MDFRSMHIMNKAKQNSSSLSVQNVDTKNKHMLSTCCIFVTVASKLILHNNLPHLDEKTKQMHCYSSFINREADRRTSPQPLNHNKVFLTHSSLLSWTIAHSHTTLSRNWYVKKKCGSTNYTIKLTTPTHPSLSVPPSGTLYSQETQPKSNTFRQMLHPYSLTFAFSLPWNNNRISVKQIHNNNFPNASDVEYWHDKSFKTTVDF